MSSRVAERHVSPWWVGIVAGMASYIDAAALVTTGIALTIYQQSIGITPDQIGLLSGILTLGVAVGSLVGGRLGDRFGRRSVFIATMGLIIVGVASMTFGTTFAVLTVGVVLIGLGVGADLPVSLATISEAATNDNRGKLLVLSNVLWVVGIIVTIVLASSIGDTGRLGGQIMFGQVGVVALLVLIGRLSIPESRIWLDTRARRAQQPADAIEAPRARVVDLLRAPYGKPFLILVLSYALINLGASTTGSFNTLIAVNFAGASVAEFNQWALVAMLFSMIPGLFFMRVVDTKRRMPFFFIGAALAISGYLIIGFGGITLVTMVIGLFLTASGHAFSFGGIQRVWAQESFPTMLRATAQGSVEAIARVSAALLAAVTPALLFANATAVYFGLAVLVTVGFLLGGVYFARSRRNEFALETDARTPEAENVAG